MTKQDVKQMDTEKQDVTPVKAKPVGLDLLREPFAPNQISKLPKPTKRQTDEVRNDFKKGIRCQQCGQWHHKDVVHLDYVGHAALTDRLLDCDPNWNWEPVATDEQGLPALDRNGGMWIRLTVCGQTRLGYGDAEGKSGGNAVKEIIGDALRNSAMRFGAALDLWHKGELHVDQQEAADPVPEFDAEAAAKRIISKLEGAKTLDDLKARWIHEQEVIAEIRAASGDAFDGIEKAKNTHRAQLEKSPPPASVKTPGGDEVAYADAIPY